MHNLVGRLLMSGKVVPEPGQSQYVDDLDGLPFTHMVASFRLVCGFRFWVWMKIGNFDGSRRKKMGVLLNTQSQLPSSV